MDIPFIDTRGNADLEYTQSQPPRWRIKSENWQTERMAWVTPKEKKISTIRARMGKLLQTCGHEEVSQRNRWMGKAQNQNGLLETMEENQNKVPNA